MHLSNLFSPLFSDWLASQGILTSQIASLCTFGDCFLSLVLFLELKSNSRCVFGVVMIRFLLWHITKYGIGWAMGRAVCWIWARHRRCGKKNKCSFLSYLQQSAVKFPPRVSSVNILHCLQVPDPVFVLMCDCGLYLSWDFWMNRSPTRRGEE